jgi:hypothetical protein
MTQADDRLTSEVMDQFSLGDAHIQQKSCISKMSLEAVTKFNKQGRALLTNVPTALVNQESSMPFLKALC